jgi:hypothetical protein
MRSDHLLLAGLAVLCASCTVNTRATETAGSRPELTDPATLTATGEPVRCIGSRNNVSTQPAGQNHVMFRAGGGRWFRNDLRGSCPALQGGDRILLFRSPSSQYCELDLFDVVDRVSRINFGACSLGRFTPVAVPKGTRF